MVADQHKEFCQWSEVIVCNTLSVSDCKSDLIAAGHRASLTDGAACRGSSILSPRDPVRDSGSCSVFIMLTSIGVGRGAVAYFLLHSSVSYGPKLPLADSG